MSKSMNRRAVLSGTATALAACTATVPALAIATRAEHPDAVLLDLCRRWHVANEEHSAVVEATSAEVEALPRPEPAPELWLTLHGEPRDARGKLWSVAELDAMVRNGKYPESVLKDMSNGFTLTWFEKPLTTEEAETAMQLLHLARDYERERKRYNELSSAIESRTAEPLQRLDALFDELNNIVATTPDGIKAKSEIIASELKDFSDDWIVEAALSILKKDIPAMVEAMNGGLVS